MRNSIWGAAVLAAAMAAASTGHAATYRSDGCQLEVPADWVASKTRIASPDKKVWASLLQASNTAEAVNLELSLKAARLGEDARTVTLVSTASFGGLTNKQYHVVTKSTPACLADVTAPAGPLEALAKSVGATVKLAR